MTPSFPMRTFFAAVALLVAISTNSTHAQMGLQAGFVEAFQPDYLNRDVTLFVEFLELEDWQQPTVESLVNDYSGDFKVGVDGLRDQMKNLKDKILSAGEQGAIGVLMVPINQWAQEKRRLKQRFEVNLRSVLSDEQQARWPGLERAMRREKELPRGVLSGESIDLRTVSRESEVPPEVMLAATEALLNYEAGLDAALLARSTQLTESQDKIKEAMVADDFATGLKELELIVATRVALRDLQDRSIDSLAAAYGEKWGAAFRALARATAYPTVYRPSPLIPFFAAAREISGLSPEQITQINAVETAYVPWYSDWQDRFANATRTEEPKKQTEETRRRMNQGSPTTPKPVAGGPYQSLYAERDAADEKARADIAAILGAELSELLPGAAKAAAESARSRPEQKAGSNRPDFGSESASPRETRGGDGGDAKAISRQSAPSKAREPRGASGVDP
ncbi:MAG: hypothetical protein EXS01_01695 [Phycisphaerales bacterium]|nr:hypothetical protein [Phycisphaerales bacterium]